MFSLHLSYSIAISVERVSSMCLIFYLFINKNKIYSIRMKSLNPNHSKIGQD